MSEFIDYLKERFETIGPDIIRKHPDSMGWIMIQKELNATTITIFDRAFSEDVPKFITAITREDWRIALDLMPGESVVFTPLFWDEFETRNNKAVEKAQAK